MEKKTPEISIVVPVYNMEKYLAQALESILGQSFQDWECIVVDDGSKDSSPAICEEYGKRDSRFKIVHKLNGGISSARNAGLRLVSGRYLAFLDSDDWLDSDYLLRLYNLIEKTGADIVQCGFIKEYTNSSHVKKLVKDKICFTKEEAMFALLEDTSLPNFVWNKLYKIEIATYPFPEGAVFEDIYTLTHWFKNVKKVILIPDTLYHYRMRQGSIIHCDSVKYQFDYLESCLCRANEFSSILPGVFTKDQRDAYLYSNIVRVATYIARSISDEKKRIDALDKARRLLIETTRLNAKNVKKKQCSRGKKLVDNPKSFARIMRLQRILDFHSRYRLKHLYD